MNPVLGGLAHSHTHPQRTRAVNPATVELSLVIPTFNEADSLPILLQRLTDVLTPWEGRYELIVVDDDSPDRTWRVAESLRIRYPAVRIIRRRAGEKGLAPSVAEGWSRARGELLGVMDADLQHPPEVLLQLLRAAEDPHMDVVIASRYLPHGPRLRWNPLRKWISRGASNLAQAVLPPQARHVTDPMSGFFLLRRRVLNGVALKPKGYKILLEVLGRGWYERVAETPYQFGRRHAGSSKLGASVMRDYLTQLWRLVWAPTGLERFVRYCLVGSSGVLIQLAATWWLRDGNLAGKLRAPAIAIECAIINNFLWNELWTFRDRARLAGRLRDRLTRFISFNMVCGVGAAIQLSIVWLLAIQGHWRYMATNLFGVAVVTVWNYGLNTTWTWARIPSAVTNTQVEHGRVPASS